MSSETQRSWKTGKLQPSPPEQKTGVLEKWGENRWRSSQDRPAGKRRGRRHAGADLGRDAGFPLPAGVQGPRGPAGQSTANRAEEGPHRKPRSPCPGGVTTGRAPPLPASPSQPPAGGSAAPRRKRLTGGSSSSPAFLVQDPSHNSIPGGGKAARSLCSHYLVFCFLIDQNKLETHF